MSEPLTVSERIIALRKFLDKSQSEFAALLGTGQSVVSDIEGGKAEPSCGVYLRLGNLSFYPDNLEFWRLAGLDRDSLASTAEALLKERTADVKALQGEGRVVLVPPFGQGEWERQHALPPLPVPADAVPNKASTFYLVATGWGFGLAPRDRVVFDIAGAMRKVLQFDNKDVVLYRRNQLLPGQRPPAAGEPRGSISIGRIRRLEENGATHILFPSRDRSEAGLSPHNALVLSSFVHPDRHYAAWQPGSSTVQNERVRLHREHAAAASDLVLDKEEILGRFLGLISGGGQQQSDQWNPVESFEVWMAKGY